MAYSVNGSPRTPPSSGSLFSTLRCWLLGHRWVPSYWHDEGAPLDHCERCGKVNV